MKDIQLQLVTFEQAKKLKQLGFDWLDDRLTWEEVEFGRNSPPPTIEDTVTVALALKWLRDEKNVMVTIICYHNVWFEFNLKADFTNYSSTQEIRTFEQSESAGLDYALDYLIKNSQ